MEVIRKTSKSISKNAVMYLLNVIYKIGGVTMAHHQSHLKNTGILFSPALIGDCYLLPFTISHSSF
jgi:hypothetical protein